jgi:hypothetical protein
LSLGSQSIVFASKMIQTIHPLNYDTSILI